MGLKIRIFRGSRGKQGAVHKKCHRFTDSIAQFFSIISLSGVCTFYDLVHRNTQVAFIVNTGTILNYQYLW